jgi:hypothetical protein
LSSRLAADLQDAKFMDECRQICRVRDWDGKIDAKFGSEVWSHDEPSVCDSLAAGLTLETGT